MNCGSLSGVRVRRVSSRPAEMGTFVDQIRGENRDPRHSLDVAAISGAEIALAGAPVCLPVLASAREAGVMTSTRVFSFAAAASFCDPVNPRRDCLEAERKLDCGGVTDRATGSQ